MRRLHRNILAIVKGNDAQSLAKRTIELLGGIESYIQAKDRVILKPNLCAYMKSTTGGTTDPNLVLGIVEEVKKITDDVIIAESDSFEKRADEAFSYCGYRDVLHGTGVKFVDLSKEELVDVDIEDGLLLRKIKLPKIVLQAKIINVPKLKTSEMTTVSLGLKNIFGLVPFRSKYKLHSSIDKAIVDINRIMRSSLTIVDAIVGMEGDGPIHGKPVKTGLVIGGSNIVAVDALSSYIIGFDARSIAHIMLAEKEGLGSTTLSETIMKGEDPERVRSSFKPARTISSRRLIIHRLLPSIFLSLR